MSEREGLISLILGRIETASDNLLRRMLTENKESYFETIQKEAAFSKSIETLTKLGLLKSETIAAVGPTAYLTREGYEHLKNNVLDVDKVTIK